MSTVEFDTPANRIIQQFEPKNKFRIDTSLPDMAFLRQLSVQGRLTYNVITNSGDPLIITPQTGTTFFIYQIILTNRSTTANNTFTVTNNGIIRLTLLLSSRIAVEGIVKNPSLVIPFFDSLVGDSVKTFQVSGSSTEDITILGWNENTSRIRDVTT